MKKQLLYFLIACGCMYSCHKKELPQEDAATAPVFYFKCNVNGIPLKVEAGINNYVMNPSHYLDENNLYVYAGELKQKDCGSNCGFALSVLINDFKYSDYNMKMEVDYGVRTGSYIFIDGGIKTFYSGHFEKTGPAPSADNRYDWSLGANVTLVHSYKTTQIFEAGQRSSVTLAVSDPTGDINALTKKFRAGNYLQTNISMVNDAGNYKFTASPKGKAPYTYLWDFGDGSPVSTEISPSHNFPYPGIYYTTQLRVIDAKNDTAVAKYQVNNNKTDVNFTSDFTPVNDPKLLSAITVKFTDQDGVTYSSADLKQPTNSNFEVVSVEDYVVNQQNEPTKKIRIKFSCSFKSATDAINITDGEAVIAVSYK